MVSNSHTAFSPNSTCTRRVRLDPSCLNEKKTPFRWLGAQALKLVICLRILPLTVKHAQDAALSNPCEEEVHREGKRAQKGSDIRDYLEPRATPHPRSPTPGQVRALPASGGGVRDAAHLRLLER